MSNSIKEYKELGQLAAENYSKDKVIFAYRIDIDNVPASS